MQVTWQYAATCIEVQFRLNHSGNRGLSQTLCVNSGNGLNYPWPAVAWWPGSSSGGL